MNNNQFKFLGALQLNDILFIALVIAGLIFSVSVDSIVLKFIGISATLIGLIGSYLSLSQKFSEMVQTPKPKVATPEYKVTVKRDTIAKRRTIEDFEDTNDDIEKKVNSTNTNSKPTARPINKTNSQYQETDSFTDETTNEHFRIIKRVKATATPTNPTFNKSIQTETKAIENNPLFENNIEINDVNLNTESLEEKTDINYLGNPEILAHDNSAKIFEYENVDQNQKIHNDQINEYNEVNEIAEENLEILTENKIIPNNAINTNSVKIEIKLPENESVEQAETKLIIQEKITFDSRLENREIEEKISDYKYKQIEDQVLNALQEPAITDDEPRREFEYFVSRLLISLRSVANVKTTTFMLYNQEKRELVLESFVTNVSDLIVDNTKFKLSNDIISQIVQNKKPEILSEINPNAALELFFYYKEDANIKSFIGIPIFYDDRVLGVVTADSEDNDAFDNNFATLLGQYSKIISGMLKSYTQKYEMALDSKTLEAIKYFNNLTNKSGLNYNDVISFLIETMSKIIDCSTIGIVANDNENNIWYVNQLSSVNDESSAILGQQIDDEISLVGNSIRENRTVFISPIEENVIRVNRNEVSMKGGYFICLPLRALNSVFGAVFIEGNKASTLTAYDITILQTIAENAGYVIEKIQLLDLIKNNSIYDANTGLLNPNAMYERMYRELERSKQLGAPPTICLIRIDRYASLNPEEHQDRMIMATEKLIAQIYKNIREFDILGQLDDDVFCIMIIGIGLEKTQLWAEKLRNEYAMTLMEIDGKKFNATLSMGLANGIRTNTVEELVENCAKALNISLEKTNHVQIYS